MSVVDRLISKIVPHECLGCGFEGQLLCVTCSAKLKPAQTCCYRCRTVSDNSLTCNDCLPSSQLYQVNAVTIYEGLAKDLIWKLKFGHAQSAAREIGILMNSLLDRYTSPAMRSNDFLIMPVPTATSRMRQRGYDQARLLARELSRSSRLPYVDVIARKNQSHQVGASRQQRLAQLTQAFRVTKSKLVRDADILLVDDVVTTGATLEVAAEILIAAGARRVSGLVFAQPRLINSNSLI